MDHHNNSGEPQNIGWRPEDGVPDLAMMSDITGDGININLKTRYKNNKIYTFAGSVLIAVNPYKQLEIYNDQWIQKYRAQRLEQTEPHIFAMAEAMYMNLVMQSDEKLTSNQACVISGESGAGKTETTKFILSYLCAIVPNKSSWMEHQILEANTILEAFGNAKTIRNDNSSRFGKFIQVCFDAHSQIKGCIIQDYLLEQSRITCQCYGERNYHVFYQLLAAGETNQDLAKKFHLMKCDSYKYLNNNQSKCYTIDGVDDCSMYDSLRLAMSVLGMPQENCDGIFSVLSSILWLGNLQFMDDKDGERCRLAPQDYDIIKTVAELLSIDVERLETLTLRREISVRGTITAIPFKVSEARDNRNGMAKALYSKTFAWIVNFINTSTNPGNDRNRFLGVLDIFGFENFGTNSFEQLCINYANEKLHRFFNHHMFALEQELYKQEGIEFCDINYTDNTRCLELLEKPPKCILRLLSEECRMPKGSDQSFISKLHQEFSQDAPHPYYIRGDDRRNWSKEFSIKHFAGPVAYNVEGFLLKNKDVQQNQLFDILESSENTHLRDLAKCQWCWSDSSGLVNHNLSEIPSFNSSESMSSGLSQYSLNNLSKTKINSPSEEKLPPKNIERPKLRTQLSLSSSQTLSSGVTNPSSFIQQRRESLTTAASICSSNSTVLHSQSNKSKPMVADAFRYQLSVLVELLNSANPWYVRCIKPNVDKSAEGYDDRQVLTQLKYLGMTDLIKIRREGFPIHFTKHQFVCRYRCLLLKRKNHESIAPNSNANSWQIKLDDDLLDETCQRMFVLLKLNPHDWKIGKSMVFLRDSIHQPIEERRKHLFVQQATIIQAQWRSFTVRKRYVQMRKAAIRIQEAFGAHRGRLNYLRIKRAAITIQAFVRGMFAREIANALREIKRVEAEELRKRAAEVERKKLLERERELKIQKEEERQRRATEIAEQTITESQPGPESACSNTENSITTNDEDIIEDDDTSTEKNSDEAETIHEAVATSSQIVSAASNKVEANKDYALDVVDEAVAYQQDNSNEVSVQSDVKQQASSQSTEVEDTSAKRSGQNFTDEETLKDRREMNELMELLAKHGISMNADSTTSDLHANFKKVYDILSSKLQLNQDTQSITSSSINDDDRYSFTMGTTGDGDNVSCSGQSQISSTMAEIDITQTSTPVDNISMVNSQDGTESDSTRGETINQNQEQMQRNNANRYYSSSIESISSITSTSSSVATQQISATTPDTTSTIQQDSLRGSQQLTANSFQCQQNRSFYVPPNLPSYNYVPPMHSMRHETKNSGLLTAIEEEPSSSTATTPSKTPLKRPSNLAGHTPIQQANPIDSNHQPSQFSQSAEIKRRRLERRISQVQQQQQQQQQQQHNNNSNNNNVAQEKQFRTQQESELHQSSDSSSLEQSHYGQTYGKLSESAIYDTRKCSMIEFAEKVFNVHPKDQSSGGVIRTLTRRRKSNDSLAGESLSKQEMLMFTPSATIPTSHIKMHDPHNSQISCSMFKNMCKYMIGEGVKIDLEIRIIQSIIRNGIERTELRDEIYVQIVRQMTNNPSNEQCTRLWILLGLVSAAFSPSKNFSNYLISYLRCKPQKDPSISCHAQFCLDNLQAPRTYPRRLPPSALEIQACKNLVNLICKVHLLDGRCETLTIHPCDTIQDVITNLASKIHLHSIDGWSLYEAYSVKSSKSSTSPVESDGDYERALRSHFYIMDVITAWQKEPVQKCHNLTTFKTAQKRLFEGNFKLTLKKRLFRGLKVLNEILKDPVEVSLLYAQAVYNVVKKDNLAVDENLALKLAGLQAQIKLGNIPQQVEMQLDNKGKPKTTGLKNETKLTNLYHVDDYICARLRKQIERTKKEWTNLIAQSHRRFHGSKDMIAKVQYLSMVIQCCRLYGTSIYHVTYRGYHHTIGPNLLLGVNMEGVEILRPEDKNRIDFYLYRDIEPRITVYNEENLLQINLTERIVTTHRCLTFETKDKEEIAFLITSYSPSHGINWGGFNNGSRVESDFLVDASMNGKRRRLKMTLEDRMRVHQDVQAARQALCQSGMLRKAMGDFSGSLLRSTLRRFSTNKSKAESIYGTTGTKDREKNREMPHTYSDYGIYGIAESNPGNNHIYDTIGGATASKNADEWTKQYPHSYWAYSKFPLSNSLLIIYDRDLEETALSNFNSILTYSGLNILSSDYSTLNSSGGISSIDTGSIDSGIASQQSLSNITKTGSPSSSSSAEIYDVCPRPINQSEQIKLAQEFLDRCLRKDADILRNEFFLQLIKQTTDHPDPNSQINIRHWQLLALACSVTYPKDRKILVYLQSHLKRCSLDQVTVEGQYAQFTFRNLQGTIETRGRKYPPSESEILSTINCRRVYASVYFLDGQDQAVEFDPCATIGEVVEQIKHKICLGPNAKGYALFQPLDDHSEQVLQNSEKVGDAISYWESWHKDRQMELNRQLQQKSNSENLTNNSGSFIPLSTITRNRVHRFVFKKYLFAPNCADLDDPVEKELLFHQIFANIKQDRFPLYEQESAMLCALKTQIDSNDQLCNISPEAAQNLYHKVWAAMMPTRLLDSIPLEAIAIHHQAMRGMSKMEAKISFFTLIQSFARANYANAYNTGSILLHRATIYEATQTFASTWPTELWLAVDHSGLHILVSRTKRVLTVCDYRSNNIASKNNFLLISKTSSENSKYIFYTKQAEQITQQIKDYINFACNEGLKKRKSVEFNIKQQQQQQQQNNGQQIALANRQLNFPQGILKLQGNSNMIAQPINAQSSSNMMTQMTINSSMAQVVQNPKSLQANISSCPATTNKNNNSIKSNHHQMFINNSQHQIPAQEVYQCPSQILQPKPICQNSSGLNMQNSYNQ